MSDRIDRIDLYLLGEMSGEEKLRFEQEMQKDPDLEKMVTRMQIINRALDVSAEDELRSYLKQLEKGQSNTSLQSPAPKIRNLMTRLAAAASILLVVSIGLWFLIKGGSSDLEEFRDEHYLAYDYTRIRGEYSQRNDFPTGYDDQEKTAQWFVAWLKTHPEDDEARFILADVYTKMKQVDKAKAELAIIISSQSILWGEKAEWNYLLLSTADTWDKDAEAILLKMIKSPSHSYHRQALELDRLLKK
jgi:thioredoxin-like negative regulator of GroEL